MKERMLGLKHIWVPRILYGLWRRLRCSRQIHLLRERMKFNWQNHQWYHCLYCDVCGFSIGVKTTNKKPIRNVSFDQLHQWEQCLIDGTRVIWRGSDNLQHPAIVSNYRNGNMTLQFEDGGVSSPCYIEQLIGIDLDDEYIEITR